MLCTTLATSLQSLLKKTKAIAIEPQELDQITALASKHKDMTGEWCPLQHCLHHRGESLKSAPQIGESGGDPDPGACLQFNHRSRLPSTVRTRSGSTPLSTLTNARPGNSMCIEPGRVTIGATSGSVLVLSSAVTVTGRSLVLARLPDH